MCVCIPCVVSLSTSRVTSLYCVTPCVHILFVTVPVLSLLVQVYQTSQVLGDFRKCLLAVLVNS